MNYAAVCSEGTLLRIIKHFWTPCFSLLITFIVDSNHSYEKINYILCNRKWPKTSGIIRKFEIVCVGFYSSVLNQFLITEESE